MTILQAVVYGDLETVTECQDNVIERAAKFNLDIIGWHHDPEGLRGFDDPSEATGLVAALGKCERTRAALYVPFPIDVYGEQRWRLIGHWLHGRGLRFFLGGAEYQWDRPIDAVDHAIRQTLDASHGLAGAVVASGAVPALEALLSELLGDGAAKEMVDADSESDCGPVESSGDMSASERDGQDATRPVTPLGAVETTDQQTITELLEEIESLKDALRSNVHHQARLIAQAHPLRVESRSAHDRPMPEARVTVIAQAIETCERLATAWTEEFDRRWLPEEIQVGLRLLEAAASSASELLDVLGVERSSVFRECESEWDDVFRLDPAISPIGGTPLEVFSDASIAAALDDLSARDWARLGQLVVELDAIDWESWVVHQSWAGSQGVLHPPREVQYPEVMLAVIEFLKDNDLIVDTHWGNWTLSGCSPLSDPEWTSTIVRDGTVPEALRLMTALVRAERLSGGILSEALESGLLMAIFERVLSWEPSRRGSAATGEEAA